jgi:hypothetical protein
MASPGVLSRQPKVVQKGYHPSQKVLSTGKTVQRRSVLAWHFGWPTEDWMIVVWNNGAEEEAGVWHLMELGLTA